jgi:hypothetical protein
VKLPQHPAYTGIANGRHFNERLEQLERAGVPWDTLYGTLSEEQTQELHRFTRQNRLQFEHGERKHDLEEKLRLQREAFEEAGRDKWLDTVYSFGHEIWVGRVQCPREQCVWQSKKLTSLAQSKGIDEI